MNMNNDRGLGFIGGFLLGGIAGAAVALLMAPMSGQDTRDQIRSEGIALKQRGQDFGDDRMHEAQKFVKQSKQGVADAQARFDNAVQDQKDNLQEAVDSGKQAMAQSKSDVVNH
jgi:gas vesicle protein